MKRRTRRIIGAGLFLLIVFFYSQFFSTQPAQVPRPTDDRTLGESSNHSTVTKVTDGDTIEVVTGNQSQKIRIIGINTPETVDPRREVECYGHEASARAKELLLGNKVRLESDNSQQNRDRYGRLLRYIYLPDGSDFGLVMIREGYAYEYTYDTAYAKQGLYKNAQKEAESQMKGLWGKDTCNK